MGVLESIKQMIVVLHLTVIFFAHFASSDVIRGEQEGYYAFEEAPSRYMRPPQVRKPPYMMSTVPCPTGEGGYNKRPSPKYTLCGDLNKGFIPLNPLGQDFDGHPYPFDLIKNKTLVFLSKALPYLKQDPKIPKVTKIGTKKSPYSQTQQNDYYGHHRQTGTQHRTKRSINGTHNGTLSETAETLHLLDNETTGRQNCDQGGASGLFCSLSSMMSNNKVPLALMSALAQSLASSMSPTTQSPVESSTSSYQSPSYQSEHSESSGGSMTDAVMGLLGTLANMGLLGNGPGTVKDSTTTCTNEPCTCLKERHPIKFQTSIQQIEEEPSTLAHVLSVLTGASPGSSNALSLVLKLMASDASPLKALAGGFPSRRRRPVGEETAASETNSRRPQENDFDLPPTPCPSSEEYVTPTFARNYQGVWKYVVQIPQEGYFTQTVQQTKCMRSRCDFMDGICHESPRWVSLLVAETYYPDSFLPATSTTLPPPPPVEDFYNFQQYLKRRVGEDDGDAEDMNYRSRPMYKEKKAKPQQHCDGIDHIGCYVVRLYYDWFLVNGSCKCWKPSPKRILTGK